MCGTSSLTSVKCAIVAGSSRVPSHAVLRTALHAVFSSWIFPPRESSARRASTIFSMYNRSAWLRKNCRRRKQPPKASSVQKRRPSNGPWSSSTPNAGQAEASSNNPRKSSRGKRKTSSSPRTKSHALPAASALSALVATPYPNTVPRLLAKREFCSLSHASNRCSDAPALCLPPAGASTTPRASPARGGRSEWRKAMAPPRATASAIHIDADNNGSWPKPLHPRARLTASAA
mmetsp:Transcript_81134/g.225773  ORF Transcript_81134/g.225773 Transcript_81134/m.225773 type:complete len:233 (-) Transcript_81134:8-706(-)